MKFKELQGLSKENVKTERKLSTQQKFGLKMLSTGCRFIDLGRFLRIGNKENAFEELGQLLVHTGLMMQRENDR